MMTYKQITRDNGSLADMVSTQDLSRFIPQTVDAGTKCKTKKSKKRKTKKKK